MVVHPVLVRVHDVVVERGVASVVSERVGGEPLRRWLASAPSWSRRIALLRAGGRAARGAAGVAHGGLGTGRARRRAGCPRLAVLRVTEGADVASDTAAFATLALFVLDGNGTRGAAGRRQRVIAALHRGARAGGANLAELREVLAQRQPARVPWPVFAVAVAVAAVAVAVGTPAPAADPSWCTAAVSQLDSLWNADVRQQLRSRLEEVGDGFGADVVARIDGALDAFAQSWRLAQQQRCAVDTPEPAVSVCLYQQFEGFRTLVEVLLEADAEAIARADAAIAALGAPAQCLQPRDAGPWRAFAGRDDVRANLVAADLLRELGRYVQSQVAAERALAAAVVARNDAAAAEAHLALALALLAQERDPEGERSLHDAFTTALAAGSDTIVARAAAELAHRLAKRRKVDQAATWIEHARAALSRVDDPRVRARVAAVEGRVALERSDFAEAEAAYRNALALAVALEPRDLATVLHARQGVAIARGRRGDRDGALELLRVNVEQTRARYGDDHPDLGRQINSVATQLAAQGRLTDAIAERQQALAILSATVGESHGDTLAATGALATDLGLAGRHAEAVAILRAALPLAEQRFGRDDDRTTSLLGELGMAEATAGDLDDAIVHLRDAVARVEAVDGRDGIALLAMTTNLAATLMFADRHEEARALFDTLVPRTERTLGRDHPQLVPVLLGAAARPARWAASTRPSPSSSARALLADEERIDLRPRRRRSRRCVVAARPIAARAGVDAGGAPGPGAGPGRGSRRRSRRTSARIEQWLHDHSDGDTATRARR
ncbi:MAG: tetratricopeptide repeat protein [Nannocystaceae bacterium]